MSASESYSDDSSTSFDSDLDQSKQDAGLSTTQDEDTVKCAGAVAVPYEDEPIADDDWVEKYEEERID